MYISQCELNDLMLFGSEKQRRRRKHEDRREECQYDRYTEDWEREGDD